MGEKRPVHMLATLAVMSVIITQLPIKQLCPTPFWELPHALPVLWSWISGEEICKWCVHHSIEILYNTSSVLILLTRVTHSAKFNAKDKHFYLTCQLEKILIWFILEMITLLKDYLCIHEN